MGFSRQEFWSGLPFSSPGDLPHPRIEPGPPALQAGSYRLSYKGSPTEDESESRSVVPRDISLHFSLATFYLSFATSHFYSPKEEKKVVLLTKRKEKIGFIAFLFCFVFLCIKRVHSAVKVTLPESLSSSLSLSPSEDLVLDLLFCLLFHLISVCSCSHEYLIFWGSFCLLSSLFVSTAVSK